MSKIHKKTKLSCMICDDIINLSDIIILHKTSRQTHSLCINCCIAYLKPTLQNTLNNIRINIRKDITIKCPGTYHSLLRNKCKHVLSLKDISINISTLSQDILRIKHLLSNHNSYICPTENCTQNIICVAPEYFGDMLKCHDGCQITWCKHCFTTPFHYAKSCIEFEVDNKNSENGKFIFDMKAKGLLKFCPQCKAPCIKTEGCNKMICSVCNIIWCWLCLTSNINYDHYNTNLSGSCTGKLWQIT
jgi:hypothetical protein